MTLCPKHQVELGAVTEGEWKGRVLICPVRGCDVNELLPTQQSQLKLTHLDPGRQYKATRASEAALIKQWEQWGGLKGYTVLRLGQDIHFISCPCCQNKLRQIYCPKCEQWSKYQIFSQNTPGTPDTFWSHPAFGHNIWKGLEGKKDEHAAVRPEQAALAALGLVDVVWSLEMVQEALKRR